MKKNRLSIALLSGLLLFSSCDKWLEQEDKMSVMENQAYTSETGINSIAANLYGRMKYWQDFVQDGDSHDLTRWDEACNNSQYWGFSGNVGTDYRAYYEYGFIRELNLHLRNLNTTAVGAIAVDKLKYFQAEARYFRAWTYFKMVVQYGGVPLVTEVTEYTDEPSPLAVPRNKESEIYDFIISEMDAIKEDFGTAQVKTRATRGAAMALKCRAALYAGTLGYNYDKSAAKTLNLSSGATGIEKSKAEGYLKACLDACAELEAMGYQLYQKQANLSTNYADLFVSGYKDNPEIIFCKAYDGVNLKNYFTVRALNRKLIRAVNNKAGCQINPVLNLVNDYEMLDTHEKKDIDAYVGDEVIEDMNVYTSTEKYNLYDKPEDIFAGRDPRLAGTILYPGSSIRNTPVDLQAGLAIPTATGYNFESARFISEVDSRTYEGQKVTGEDGPLRSDDGASNWYICHSGFLMRKFVDTQNGSEVDGQSSVPYIVFRFGEMLLNAAEAAFYLNEMGVASYNGRSTKTIALDYINRIRQRAGGDVFKLSENELTFERIMNERRVELAFEDHRYEDLKRWRIADEVWHYDQANQSATIYVLWPYKVYAPGTPEDGKWLYRKMKAQNRPNNAILYFDDKMYYNLYPRNEGNPNIEPNPNH